MRTIVSFLFLFCLTFAYTQDKTYFDQNWEVCSKDKAAYYRVIDETKNGFEIKDYYIDGEIQFKAISKVKDEPLQYDGLVTWYYRNGNKASYFTYVNGVPQGKAGEYFVNGKVKSEGYNINGNWEGVFTFYEEFNDWSGQFNYKNNIVNGPYYEFSGKDTLCKANIISEKLDGLYYRFDTDGKLIAKGNFVDGELDGEFYFNSRENQLKATFKKGILNGPYVLTKNITSDTIVKADIENGQMLSFHFTFKINNEVWERKGTYDGEKEHWDAYIDGNLVMQSSFLKGFPAGEWKIFNREGSQLLEKITFNPYSCGYNADDVITQADYVDFRDKLRYPLSLVPSFPERHYQIVIPEDYECADGPYERFDNNGELLFKCFVQNGDCKEEPYERDELVDDVNHSSFLYDQRNPFRSINELSDLPSEDYWDSEDVEMAEIIMDAPPFEYNPIEDFLNKASFKEKYNCTSKKSIQICTEKLNDFDLIIISSVSKEDLKEYQAKRTAKSTELIIYIEQYTSETEESGIAWIRCDYGEEMKQFMINSWDDFSDHLWYELFQEDRYRYYIQYVSNYLYKRTQT